MFHSPLATPAKAIISTIFTARELPISPAADKSIPTIVAGPVPSLCIIQLHNKPGKSGFF